MQTAIHVLTQNDLRGVITRAGRIRAYCPIHGSDRQRSLSIALAGDLQGFGYCHSCKATVLLADLNQDAARHLGYTGGVQELAIAAPQAEKWQRDELAALAAFYPRMRAALAAKISRAYLTERAIPFEIAEQLGVCYLPALSRKQLQAEPGLSAIPAKWYDRLIFPYKAYDGATGYAGRSLKLWRPGMNEDEHKQLLDEQGIIRYQKTWRGGLFPGAILDTSEHITLTEGPFDALALAAAGIADAVAIIGTTIETAALPINIETVTLAFDSDAAGVSAAHKLAKELWRDGRPANICTPPQDEQGKDWSERYRLHGRGGLAALFATLASDPREAFNQAQEDTGSGPGQPVAPVASEPVVCAACGIDIALIENAGVDSDGALYCGHNQDGAYCASEQRREQVMKRVSLVEDFFGSCSLRWFDEPLHTPEQRKAALERYVAELQQQQRDQWRDMRTRARHKASR